MDPTTESKDAVSKIKTHDEIEEQLQRKPPPGRKPILPRVYEAWTDEFEEEDEFKEPDGRSIGSDEDIRRHIFASKKTRKQRAAECAARYEEFLRKEEEERVRQAEAQRLEDLRFPSIFGLFYTNGYYDMYPPFGVKDELVEPLTAQSVEFEERRRKREPETFTEKFRRHFWPPKLLLKGKMFRTRGCYLDFPEVLASKIEDIDVDFGKKSGGILSNTDATLKDEDADEYDPYGENKKEGEGEGDAGALLTEKPGDSKTIVPAASGAIIPPIPGGDFNVGWEDYYYDDETGEFIRKVPGLDIEYYFDGHNSCWRRKRGKKTPQDQQTPYDFYFDNNEFYPREKYWGKHTLDIAFDEKLGVWKYDPKHSTRLLIQAGGTGHQSDVKKVPVGKGATKTTPATAPKKKKKKKKHPDELSPEDFYFDELELVWKKKMEASMDIRIENDENGRRWIYRVEGDWRGLTGNSPDDYYFDESTGRFQSRPKRLAENYWYSTVDGVWRPVKPPKFQNRSGLTCADYFFEDGQFKKKEPHSENLYRKMRYALIYVKKDLPTSGLFPEDFYFDHSKKLWLPRTIRMTMLKAKDDEIPWDKGGPGKSAPVILSRDDWYFDIEEGVFIKKTAEGIKNRIYYFDSQEGVWKSIELREKHRLHALPHDFYFNGTNFAYKDRKSQQDNYVYNEPKGVYRLKDERGKGDPSSYYFDYEREMWKARTEAANAEMDFSGHFVKKFPERKCPDDYYFDESDGRFMAKETAGPDAEYTFVDNEGVYKIKGKKGPSVNGLTSRDFYYDDYDGRWKLKIQGEDKEYWWDKNNKFFRHIVSLSTRTGLKATDYYFSPNIGSWFPVVNFDVNRGRIRNDKLEWDPLRNYDKPWLLAAPIRYGQGKKGLAKVAPQDIWEGTERIPFDRAEGTSVRFDRDKLDEPPPSLLKMKGIDVYTAKPEEIRKLFPKAIDVEINNTEEAAYITFPSDEYAKDAQAASKGQKFNGKAIKLQKVEQDQ